MEQPLSPQGKAAIESINALSLEEHGKVVSLASVELAARIAKVVGTANPEARAEASSSVASSVLAAAAPAISNTHDFKLVSAPDGTAAIEVTITGRNGAEITCLLSEGARGKSPHEVAGYGTEKLKGATLLSREGFHAVVDSLFEAIKGKRVVDGDLQTEDLAVRKAYQIVNEGVRTRGHYLWARFDFDNGGAVVGRRVDGYDGYWDAYYFRDSCAAFVAPPAEKK